MLTERCYISITLQCDIFASIVKLTLATLAATDTAGLSTVSATPLITSPPAIFSLSFIEVLGSASAWLSATSRPVLRAASAYSFSVEGI